MDRLSQRLALAPKYKILCLDGGGVRGLSTLLILRRLMRSLGNRLEPKRPELKPCEFFDLIGGTSTGGIIALMLGRLRMSVQECIDKYTKLSKSIFSERKPSTAKELFYAENLEEAIKSVIRKRLGEHAEDAPLEDPLAEEACKAVVYTLPKQHAHTVEAQALRTYSSDEYIPCTIWQAARATSAAPVFLESIRFGNPPADWIDAGLGFNNPGKLLLAEAARIWEDDDGHFSRDNIGLFLSLGTGKPRVLRINFKDDNVVKRALKDIADRAGVPVDVIEAMQAIVTDAEKVAHELRSDLAREVYYRFNVEQGLQEIKLFQYEHEEEISVDTEAYIKEHERDIKDCTLLMSKFPLQLGPLRSGPGRAGVPHFPEIPHDVAISYELDRQGVGEHEFRKHNKGLKRREELELTSAVDYLWDYLVLGDLLERRGRGLLEAYHENKKQGPRESSNRSRPSLSETLPKDIKARAEHVDVQCRSSCLFWNAYKYYRALRVSQIECFGETSLDVLWTTHRLAGLSVMLGLLEDAHALYVEACRGREQKLGAEHKTTIYSRFGAMSLEKHFQGMVEGGGAEQGKEDGWWKGVRRGLKKSVSFGVLKISG